MLLEVIAILPKCSTCSCNLGRDILIKVGDIKLVEKIGAKLGQKVVCSPKSDPDCKFGKNFVIERCEDDQLNR